MSVAMAVPVVVRMIMGMLMIMRMAVVVRMAMFVVMLVIVGVPVVVIDTEVVRGVMGRLFHHLAEQDFRRSRSRPAVFELRRDARVAVRQGRDFDADGAVGRLDGLAAALERIALHPLAANTERRGFQEQHRFQRPGFARTAEHLHDDPGPALLHLRRQQRDVQRARGHERGGDVAQHFRGVAVDVGFELHDRLGLQSGGGLGRLADQQADEIRDGQVARAGAAAHGFEGHRGNRPEGIGQLRQQRRAGRGDQLLLDRTAHHRNALEQHQGGRGRQRDATVRALNEAAAHRERRDDHLFNAQRFKAGQHAADVHDSVHTAHFVQMYVLDARAMDGGLGLADAGEDADGPILDLAREAAGLHHRLEIGQMALGGVVAHLHVHLDRPDAILLHPRGVEREVADVQRGEPGAQGVEGQTRVEQSAEDHVAARTGDAVEVSRFHEFTWDDLGRTRRRI